MAGLYAPLALGDFLESRKQRQEGGRGMVPFLGGLALSAMAAPHVADPLMAYMKRNQLTTAGELAKHLMGRLKAAPAAAAAAVPQTGLQT